MKKRNLEKNFMKSLTCPHVSEVECWCFFLDYNKGEKCRLYTYSTAEFGGLGNLEQK